MVDKFSSVEQKKRFKSMTIKFIIIVILGIILSIIMKSIEPLISAEMAVSQLNGENLGYVELQAYQSVKYYVSLGWYLSIALLYLNDVIYWIKYAYNKFVKGNKK